MRIKIITAFDSLFNEEIFNLTNPEYPCQVGINKDLPNEFFGNPFSYFSLRPLRSLR